MPARATQPAGYASGQAQVRVTGADAVDIDTLEVCISELLDGVEKHLDPRLTGEAWTTTYAWFRPGSPRADGSALSFDLEPSVTWHLRPHTPYILRLRDARGLRREERLTWVAIRLPSRAPQGYVPPAGPARGPVAAKETPAEAGDVAEAEARRAQAEREAAVAAALAVDLKRGEDAAAERRRDDAERLRRRDEERERAEREAQEQTRRPARGRSIVLAAVAALVLAGAVGAWFFKDRWSATETPVAAVPPEVPTTLDGARRFLARDPGADESFGMAERFRAAKSLDGEFLLLRNAANKGNAPAALALGQMYDPATYSPETSPLPAPNPEQAAAWYRQAAEAGIAEAQYRLGMLLMSGKTDEPNGPELGVAWLRKAADQGHPQAKDALPK
jgi:Sel1 repeat-containing protein